MAGKDYSIKGFSCVFINNIISNSKTNLIQNSGQYRWAQRKKKKDNWNKILRNININFEQK